MDYKEFIKSKSQLDGNFGFDPYHIPDEMFPFQAHITERMIRKGRGAIFADCGLGKTFMEIVWADNVYKHTGKPVLILTPLAVSGQFIEEGQKFGYDVNKPFAHKPQSSIVVTNYERLHYLNVNDFGGVACDESSILKNYDGKRKAEITEFMRPHKYRLLATATAAPNDYTELGTSSEALGYYGYMDMLGMFFTNRQKTIRQYHGKYKLVNNDKWRFKGHAEEKFWRWVSSWAIAVRKPSDLGFDDNGFILPPANIIYHDVMPAKPPPGMLFALPAVGLQELRQEQARTYKERCEKAYELTYNTGKQAVIWCHRNKEADLLEKLIPDATQVSGKDSDDKKEEKFHAFKSGEIRVLVTKPKIGAWGLNWQHCNHTVYFPSYSYEQYYQAVRRFVRFGQLNEVTVDVVGTSGELKAMESMQQKEIAAMDMFNSLVKHMNNSIEIKRLNEYTNKVEVPSWL